MKVGPIVGAAVAAVLGAIIWAVISATTGYEVGYVDMTQFKRGEEAVVCFLLEEYASSSVQWEALFEFMNDWTTPWVTKSVRTIEAKVVTAGKGPRLAIDITLVEPRHAKRKEFHSYEFLNDYFDAQL